MLQTRAELERNLEKLKKIEAALDLAGYSTDTIIDEYDQWQEEQRREEELIQEKEEAAKDELPDFSKLISVSDVPEDVNFETWQD